MYRSYPSISERVYFSECFLMRGEELVIVTENRGIVPPKGSMNLHRYMRISNLAEIIKNGKIRFDSPLRWNDPFEFLFYVPRAKIGGKEYSVACGCFTWDSIDNEESLWNVHGQDGDLVDDSTTIRVSFHLDKLCKRLAECNPNVLFYVSDIDYSLSRKEIIGRYSAIPDKEVYSDIGEYIHNLSLKRKAFAYENEIRIFAVCEECMQFDDEMFHLFDLSFREEMVSSITLPPLLPKHFKGKWKDYSKELDKRGEKIRAKLLHEAGYKKEKSIRQSRLYDIEIKAAINSKKLLNRHQKSI